MPNEKPSTLRAMFAQHLATQERIAEKQDELCERLSNVERELVGEPGDGDKPTMRGRVKTLEDRIDGLATNARWAAGLLAALIVATWAALLAGLRGGPPKL